MGKSIPLKESNAEFASSAPGSLVYLYGVIGPGKQILGRLLRGNNMQKAWADLEASWKPKDQGKYSTKSPNDPYRRLWSEIVSLYIRRPEKRRADVDADLSNVARAAEKLRGLIVNPDRVGEHRPRNIPLKTGARFDARVNSFFPNDVTMINSRLPVYGELEWPVLSEVLEQLIERIAKDRQQEKTARRLIDRDSVGRSGQRAQKIRLFVIGLTRYLEQECGVSRKDVVPIVQAIAAAVYDEKVLRDAINKALRGR